MSRPPGRHLSKPFYVELFGGPRDGRVIEVDTAILRAQKLILAREPTIALSMWSHVDIAADPLETWVWDRTITSEGRYRFRCAQ